MRKLAEQLSTYPTGQNLSEVYWRSLICNSTYSGTKASPDMRESFDASIECTPLASVFYDHYSGQYRPESSEDVLCRLECIAPYIDWRLHIQSVPGTLDPQFWDAIWKRVQELHPRRIPFQKTTDVFSSYRRYFASDLGYLGWVPRDAQEGDRICAFYGCRFPFVIRPKGEGFQLVGACYMHGIMEGEAIELPNTEGEAEEIIITLV